MILEYFHSTKIKINIELKNNKGKSTELPWLSLMNHLFLTSVCIL